jgi:sugar/nucleoside kinase (ribokinase family)
MGRLDVLAVGNALVDVLSLESDEFVVEHGLERGAMTLIDAERAERLYAAMGPGTEISGGSAANTAAGLASLGARVGFVGRVRDDQLGEVFAHDIHAIGVEFTTAPAADGPPTGRCLIIVTPDAQRTLNTFLGAAADLHPDDIDRDVVSASAVTFLEGYLFDQDDAKEAFRHAGRLAHEAGNRVALTLSDPFCVERHRADFRDLVEHHVDVLFANEQEICSLYEVDDFDTAAGHVRGHCEIAALTRSEQGSVIVADGDSQVVGAAPVDQVVDTTGAGDQYAAGFLYGLTHGHDLATCGRLGSIAAAEVISHLGARPEVSLADLAASQLGDGQLGGGQVGGGTPLGEAASQA